MSAEEETKTQHRPSTNPALMEQCAKELLKGAAIAPTLIAAGYSPQHARQGRKAIPRALWKEIAKQGKGFAAIGQELTPDMVAQTIKGRLFYNTVKGDYKGESSAKLLGSMRDYNLFTPDNLTGVIVLQQPNQVQAGKPLQLPDTKDFEDV